jgi:hypothetical protein
MPFYERWARGEGEARGNELGDRPGHQTTNLGVRSSNLFGRATKPIKTIDFCGRPFRISYLAASQDN